MEITPYSARLSYFRIPVETFTPPLLREKGKRKNPYQRMNIIHQLLTDVKRNIQEKQSFRNAAEYLSYHDFGGYNRVIDCSSASTRAIAP